MDESQPAGRGRTSHYTRTHKEAIADKEGSNHRRDEEDELQKPKAVVKSRARIFGRLDTDGDDSHEEMEESHSEHDPHHPELTPGLHYREGRCRISLEKRLDQAHR